MGEMSSDMLVLFHSICFEFHIGNNYSKTSSESPVTFHNPGLAAGDWGSWRVKTLPLYNRLTLCCDLWKRAAANLKFKWPEVQPEVCMSRYNGKKIPKGKRTGRQLLLVFPQLLEEFAVSLRNKCYRERHSVAGSSVRNCEGIETQGFHSMPPIWARGGGSSSPKDILVHNLLCSPQQSKPVLVKSNYLGLQGSYIGNTSP